jgi:CheY-like chemotaxis protein
VFVEEKNMPQRAACRVLLVDDEPAIRNLLSTLLEEAGFEAEQAEDGLDGLLKLREKLPNVIISDLTMPRMSGFEFLAVVRQRFPQIPVFVHSGVPPDDFPEVRPDLWFQKGATQFSTLLEAVHDWTRKTPDPTIAPQSINTPLRTQRDGAGYYVLTCTDCLRTLRVRIDPETPTIERTACCVFCQAILPYLIESSNPS